MADVINPHHAHPHAHPAGGLGEAPNPLNLAIAKFGAGAIITLFGLIGVLLPYKTKLGKNKKIVDWVSAFGGGAFLALGLFHILPETSEEYTNHIPKSHKITINKHELPVVNILAFVGFSLILALERVVFSSEKVEQLHAHDHDHDHDAHHHHAHHSHSHCHNHAHHDHTPHTSPKPQLADINTPREHQIHIHEDLAANICLPCEEVIDETEECVKNLYASRSRLHSIVGSTHSLVQRRASHISSHHSLSNNLVVPEVATRDLNLGDNMFVAYLMMVALSIHNLFEGIVVGNRSEALTAILLAATIVPHHIVAGFALAMGFVKKGINGKSSRIALACFVGSSPIGVWIGSWMKSDSPVGIYINAIAAGTVLYVATCEIIAEEFAIGRRRRSKFVSYLLGAIVVGLCTLLHMQAHDHNHSHPHPAGTGHGNHAHAATTGHHGHTH